MLEQMIVHTFHSFVCLSPVSHHAPTVLITRPLTSLVLTASHSRNHYVYLLVYFTPWVYIIASLSVISPY